MAAKTEEEAPVPIGRQIAELVSEIPALHPDKEGQLGHRKFKYIPLEQIMPAIRPGLANRGWWLTHDSTQTGQGDWQFETVLKGPGCENLAVSRAPLLVPNDVRELGKVLTHMRRYTTAMLFALVADEDTDADGVGTASTKTPKAEDGASLIDQVALLKRVDELTEEQVVALKAEVIAFVKQHGSTPKQFAELMVELTEKGKLHELTSDELNTVLAEIEARGKA